MALIELEDVRKSYQLGPTTVEALRGVSLSIVVKYTTAGELG